MKILFLSRWYPYPPDNGAKIRVFNLLRQLSRAHTVDLITFSSGELGAGGNPPEPLAAVCRRVETVPYKPFEPGRVRALAGFFSPQPRNLIDTFNPDLQQRAINAVRAEHHDLVIASEIDMAPYAMSLPVPARILEELELTLLYENYAHQPNPLRRFRSSLTWRKLSGYLPGLLDHFQGCTVVSEKERSRLLAVAPRAPSVEVVPNGVDLAYLNGDFGSPETDTLIYNGAMTYRPNEDAVRYFLAEIFPRVLAKRPQVRLYVTGKTGEIRTGDLPCSEAVTFTGYLADVRPRVARSWASVVPLRAGGGSRLKVLESLALGTPVVSSAKGAEGLSLRPGEEFLQADDPEAFAAALLRLLDDRELREQLVMQGKQAVSERYDWNKIGDTFNRYIEMVVNQPSLVERKA